MPRPVNVVSALRRVNAALPNVTPPSTDCSTKREVTHHSRSGCFGSCAIVLHRP